MENGQFTNDFPIKTSIVQWIFQPATFEKTGGYPVWTYRTFPGVVVPFCDFFARLRYMVLMDVLSSAADTEKVEYDSTKCLVRAMDFLQRHL
jgi:hypothetical protein